MPHIASQGRLGVTTPMMSLIEIIEAKRAHLARFANQSGAAGELSALAEMKSWVSRPKGKALQVLLAALRDTGISIKASSFDAVAFPPNCKVDFMDPESVASALPRMCFVEIKSASQSRVKPNFDGFFFALTENEISAADQLGDRHLVALYNKISGAVLLTSVPEILARARSSTWQLSVQL